ncbi:MAG: hypothetical protein ACJAS4_002005 [Bacteriovoracaceae bacterium]|jgi:hypothetical protein
MRKTILVLFIIFTSGLAFSQEKSNNNDLRIKREIFSIKEFSGKNHILYKLESSITGQFNILISKKNKIVSNKKVDTSEAQKMDDEFVDRFISFKYMMKARSKKKCQNSFFLSLRGEGQQICADEKAKIEKIKAFINTLKNKFS